MKLFNSASGAISQSFTEAMLGSELARFARPLRHADLCANSARFHSESDYNDSDGDVEAHRALPLQSSSPKLVSLTTTKFFFGIKYMLSPEKVLNQSYTCYRPDRGPTFSYIDKELSCTFENMRIDTGVRGEVGCKVGNVCNVRNLQRSCHCPNQVHDFPKVTG